MKSRIMIMGALVCLALAASEAHADKKAAGQAKKHYQQGTIHYNAGDFELAIQEYLAGYRIKPDPVFLFNAAQSYRQLGNHEKALFYYKGYLREAPEAPNRGDVDERIRDLEELIQKRREAEASPPSGPAAPGTARTDIPDPAEAAEAGEAAEEEGPSTTPAPPVTDGGGARPIYKKWWFWTAIGAVAIGTTAVIIATSGDDGVSPPDTAGGNLTFF